MLKNYWEVFLKTKIHFIFAETKHAIMFDFDQYLGFLAFLTILTIGFWLMIFLVSIIPYWIGGALIESIKLKREAKKNEKK
ncbi:MAG: hypothetical protein ACSHW7_07530 [Patiriisocius sp.]|uniref:hypothetical protein n=1 Tax=Patiriisocius sp. TaxID=2822396 RepID=UPI003EF46683